MKLSDLTKYCLFQLYHANRLASKLSQEGDSEDLHQFRVAIRRVRSLVKLYLPGGDEFPRLIKESVKQTNPLRELDVMLASLNCQEYTKTFRRIKKIRDDLYETTLTAPFKSDLTEALRLYYDELCDRNPTPKAPRLIETSETYFRECLCEYNTLTDDSGPKKFHTLRNRFKTARYSLEFLTENKIMDEQKKMDQCKTFQEILGAMQDTRNQLSWFKKIHTTHKSKETEKLIKIYKKRLKNLKESIIANQPAISPTN